MAKPAIDTQWEAAVRHEAAGWQVARALGFPNIVAATVLRETPRLTTGDPVRSSVQVTWPEGWQWCAPLSVFREDELWQAAVFDAVVLHTDHSQNNWLAVPAPEGSQPPRLALVDTGYAFSPGGPEPGSSFYQEYRGKDLPEHTANGLRNLIDNWPEALNALLENDERDQLRQRCQTLVESGVLDLRPG
jgi:hypothetical protein